MAFERSVAKEVLKNKKNPLNNLYIVFRVNNLRNSKVLVVRDDLYAHLIFIATSIVYISYKYGAGITRCTTAGITLCLTT